MTGTQRITTVGTQRKTAGSLVKTAVERVLGVPLVAKLIGANVIIVAAALLVHAPLATESSHPDMLTVLIALAAASVVNFALVRVALKPVEDLEVLARQVSEGDFDVRSTPSLFADAELARLSNTLNSLLDSLAAERKRIHDLGADVVSAQEDERALVSRELHDSIAQTLAAVRYQLAAAGAGADNELQESLGFASDLIVSAMEEIRNVSYALHPRVAEDLGIDAALRTLARQVEERSGIHIEVVTDAGVAAIPRNAMAMIFRVAEEALRSVEVHSDAKSATVNVTSREGSVRLDITDDGHGFDPSLLAGPATRSGLSLVKDRVTLAGGRMRIDSTPNGGTRVTAELKTMKAAS